MANRAYLYSLSNRPTAYADRPETISGLSEWAYAIPFSYRALLSGDPRLCASLVSDGFESEPSDKKSKLYAISGDFAAGFARFQKLLTALRPLAAAAPNLTAIIDETLTFLETHHDRYLLLETIELDCMEHADEAGLRSSVDREINACFAVGAAIDALSADPAAASQTLQQAAQKKYPPPLDAFHGLRLDDDYDNVYEEKTEHPLGLEWSEVLYYELWNRAQFAAGG